MEYSLSVLKDPSRIPELIELFRTGLGETTEAYWMWRLFTDNGQPDPPIAVAVEDEAGTLCAMSTILPIIYGGGTSHRKCLQFCDWVVRPDRRGRGLIRMIYDFVCRLYQEKEYDFILEFPNDNSYPIFTKYGFCEEPPIPCFSSPRRLPAIRPRLTDFSADGVEVCFSDSCPLTDEIFTRPDRIERTPAYLRWKYDQNPDTDYKWVGFRQNGSFIGYIVYTLTRGRLRTAVNVYDWEYPLSDTAAFCKAIRAIGRLGSFVSIWGRYDARSLALLGQCGLKESAGGTRLMLKSLSAAGCPESLTLTRIDTDY